MTLGPGGRQAGTVPKTLENENQAEGGRDAVRGWVAGRVQGVGFRWFVLQTARQLGLAGEVSNLHDGRVAFRAQGREQAIARFLDAVRQGPPGSRVDDLNSERVPAEPGRVEFVIR